LEGSSEKFCKRIEEEALNISMQAAKMILERFLSPYENRLIRLELQKLETLEIF
jgi:hypothetical protein